LQEAPYIIELRNAAANRYADTFAAWQDAKVIRV